MQLAAKELVFRGSIGRSGRDRPRLAGTRGRQACMRRGGFCSGSALALASDPCLPSSSHASHAIIQAGRPAGRRAGGRGGRSPLACRHQIDRFDSFALCFSLFLSHTCCNATQSQDHMNLPLLLSLSDRDPRRPPPLPPSSPQEEELHYLRVP